MLLRFHWKSLGTIVTACFGLQYLLLYFMYQPIQELTEYYDPEQPQILVIKEQIPYKKITTINYRAIFFVSEQWLFVSSRNST